MTRRVALPSLVLLLSACTIPTVDDPFAPVDTFTPTTGPSTATDAMDDSGTGQPVSCTDGMQGGDETDVDCGGSCNPCGDGQGCASGDDCSSGVCTNQECQPAACGDGVVQEGEECDEGEPSASCSDQCVVPACGNGVIDDDEQCDDAGESASCNADCSPASCGDGVVNAAAGEECDEGGDTIACDGDCTAVACGDGYANPAVGEDCDDGGETAACNADCSAASCGDQILNAAAGEECEGVAGCDGSCQWAGCAPDPEALALAACAADGYANCVVADGGVVGWNAPECQGCNCGLPADPWRFYCTVTAASNYNCSACTVGEILGPHDPCNCDPGTSPVLGQFCMP